MIKLTSMIENLLRDRKLILVSNREPYAHEKTTKGITSVRSSGGLVSALDPVMKACEGIWIASGNKTTDFEVGARVQVPPNNPKYTLQRIRLSEDEMGHFYRGFSNRSLWPLFHLFTDRARFKPKYWDAYRKVNIKFANAVLREMKPNDLVWIQDYHFALVPDLIRKKMNNANISFFWHIPWIPFEVFQKLPWSKEFLEGMLGADLIGFHTRNYSENFMECVRKELSVPIEIRKGLVKFESRRVKAKEFPIGIDYNQYASPPKEATELAEKLSGINKGKHILLSIDRLDYTKGILERLKTFEKFLEKYPSFRGAIIFMLVVTPSRMKVADYRKMKEDIDRQVGYINSKFQRMDWAPIDYYCRNISQNELLSFYRVADAALITPLKDGMNVISKEYIATSNGGVLILSKFAGASQQLRGAIQVNPYDVEKTAAAIKFALKMPWPERKRRLNALKRNVRKFDVYWWAKKFFEEWERQLH